MNDINIYFTREEFVDRQQRARERMAALDLEGILLFKFKDMYWLTGFDSDGFTIFGCMFLGVSLNHVAGAMSTICNTTGR